MCAKGLGHNIIGYYSPGNHDDLIEDFDCHGLMLIQQSSWRWKVYISRNKLAQRFFRGSYIKC